MNDDLSIPGHPEVFVVGDLAVLPTRGKPVPGSGAGGDAERPDARRETSFTRSAARGASDSTIATRAIWRRSADIRRSVYLAGQQLSGWFAWWTWLLVHIMYLAGFRNRLSVLLEWGYSFFTYQRGSRLITADRHPPPESGRPLRA